MKDDLIRRGELAEEVKSLTVHVTGLRAGKGVLQEYAKQFRDSLLRIIDEQPAVDAVEVVRCGECLHHAEQNGIDSKYCRMHDTAMGAEDFCSYGVRREDDGEKNDTSLP